MGGAALSQYPGVIELSSLTGVDGFKINGEAAGDYSGFSVALAGDVNGDGQADFQILVHTDLLGKADFVL